MKNKLYLILIFTFLIIIMMDVSVFAHKVNVFACVEGEKIYTESYFNDGKKCIDSKIEVFDNQGNKLLEGLTDKEGKFSFEVSSENGDLKIVLTASMGHRAEYTIRTDELRDTMGSIEESIEKPIFSEKRNESSLAEMISEEKEAISPEISSLDLNEIRSLIEDALDEKLKPIMIEIKKSQEDKISPTEIIGGIGYIIGIFGIIAYFLSRKR
jgi:nickel transport protein